MPGKKKQNKKFDMSEFELDPNRISKVINANVFGEEEIDSTQKDITEEFIWGSSSRKPKTILDFDNNHAYLTVILVPKEESVPYNYTLKVNHSTGEIEKIKPLMPSQDVAEAFMRWSEEGLCKFLGEDSAVDPIKVYKDILAILKKYIYFGEKTSYDLLTLWIIGTYLFPLFQAYPFILLTGPFASGKSRTTKLASYLSFNSQLLTSPNEAIMYRYVDAYKSSLFFDNAEWLSRPKYTRLTDTLNSSYKKGAKVTRIAGTKKGPMQEFEIYSPKMFNNTTGAETIINSRSIIINQIRAPKNIAIEKNLPSEEDPIWGKIRHQLYLFMFNYWKEIKALIPAQA